MHKHNVEPFCLDGMFTAYDKFNFNATEGKPDFPIACAVKEEEREQERVEEEFAPFVSGHELHSCLVDFSAKKSPL